MSECFEEQCPIIARYNTPETGRPTGLKAIIGSLGAAASVEMNPCPGVGACMEKAWPESGKPKPSKSEE